MSKTDETRPAWVQMADVPMVTCVPVHDHRFGVCMLPDGVTADSASQSHRTSGCYWGVTAYYWYSDGCTGGAGEWHHIRREERRRSQGVAVDG
ncbi:hypothetical protein [Microbispora sp. NPDC046933]|uniref:hypothetical protein n=1 Tax=Microbispora sp. NPDC046933 TaxID=3155618 RepID=UPI0033C89B46